MVRIERLNGGLVTALTGDETLVTLGGGRFDLLDVGYDSANAAQTTAKVFVSLGAALSPQQLAADFKPAEGKLYLRQSTASKEFAIRVSGQDTIRVMALTAESTLMIRPVVD